MNTHLKSVKLTVKAKPTNSRPSLDSWEHHSTTFLPRSLNLDALLVDDAPTKSMNRLPKRTAEQREVPRQEAEAEAEAEGGSNFYY